ncbi:DUF2169 domain-containing protein [Pseudoalteromonas sp. NEC-BIFX-2020_015]|uniref:DUF2169 family type VI secretion system accessory protein n=1 Tax=Pseudoalteromonas sp. NEC-BIFX-2020_015 TaxID=2729544 RepID=UPI0014614DD7|nr:DUF2169 domain-containing protein [Pseudoalteromonas sp. NEC-BIFX-2020_015]NMR26337.1 DUF2169 domain-containing protein [Pseudoalteromonas sp. NEC-BIFX-2020_015]
MINNFSPWQASTFTGWLEDSNEGQIVLVKQSYEFDEQGKVTAIEPGPEIIIADDYQDEPSNSPICEVNEQVAFKHGFEVYGNCTAYPPKGKNARVIEVELGLDSPSQPLFKKRLRVTGARFWRRSLLGPVATDPDIIAPLALNYMHAFGGKELNNESNYLLENPIGRGFKLKNKHAVGQQLPRVEYATSLLRKPSHNTPVASFTAIPSHWSPRVELIPEIDETALMASEYPFKTPQPKDLYNTAPSDQCVEAEFANGWALQLTGLYPLQQYGQQQRIALPYQPPIVEVVNTLARHRLDMRCDTLVIDSDAQSFSLLWRGHISIEKIGANSQILVAAEPNSSKEN